jgi:hypothetical protein
VHGSGILAPDISEVFVKILKQSNNKLTLDQKKKAKVRSH